jgi:hypothetical protein
LGGFLPQTKKRERMSFARSLPPPKHANLNASKWSKFEEEEEEEEKEIKSSLIPKYPKRKSGWMPMKPQVFYILYIISLTFFF